MSGDTLVNAETGEVIAQMTPAEARRMLKRMHTGMGVLTELYIEAYNGRIWAALGHASWDAFLAAEFGGYQLRLPSEERDETIMSLRAAGLSIRAIAATGVASKSTVERTIEASGVVNEDTSVTGTDGKTYDAAKRAAARREAEPAPEEAPTKCTDGFDCPATPGPDGLCAWHRGKRRAEIPTAEVPAPPPSDPSTEGTPGHVPDEDLTCSVGNDRPSAVPDASEGTAPSTAVPSEELPSIPFPETIADLLAINPDEYAAALLAADETTRLDHGCRRDEIADLLHRIDRALVHLTDVLADQEKNA